MKLNYFIFRVIEFEQVCRVLELYYEFLGRGVEHTVL
jgi:hypothetical protein